MGMVSVPPDRVCIGPLKLKQGIESACWLTLSIVSILAKNRFWQNHGRRLSTFCFGTGRWYVNVFKADVIALNVLRRLQCISNKIGEGNVETHD